MKDKECESYRMSFDSDAYSLPLISLGGVQGQVPRELVLAQHHSQTYHRCGERLRCKYDSIFSTFSFFVFL